MARRVPDKVADGARREHLVDVWKVGVCPGPKGLHFHGDVWLLGLASVNVLIKRLGDPPAIVGLGHGLDAYLDGSGTCRFVGARGIGAGCPWGAGHLARGESRGD